MLQGNRCKIKLNYMRRSCEAPFRPTFAIKEKKKTFHQPFWLITLMCIPWLGISKTCHHLKLLLQLHFLNHISFIFFKGLWLSLRRKQLPCRPFTFIDSKSWASSNHAAPVKHTATLQGKDIVHKTLTQCGWQPRASQSWSSWYNMEEKLIVAVVASQFFTTCL